MFGWSVNYKCSCVLKILSKQKNRDHTGGTPPWIHHFTFFSHQRFDYVNTNALFTGIPAQNAEIWLLDRALGWHLLADSFLTYYRLMLTHMGLPQWQYSLTDIGVIPPSKGRSFGIPLIVMSNAIGKMLSLLPSYNLHLFCSNGSTCMHHSDWMLCSRRINLKRCKLQVTH